MLWFNEDKDAGALRTDDGDRIEIPGTAFSDGEKPVGRCAGKLVDFDAEAGTITRIAFVPEVDQRRARLRSRR
jgi:hypothetical protein